MARYDVFPDQLNTSGYLLDVQSDILAKMETRVVVPLIRIELYPFPSHRLNPTFQIDDKDYVMGAQFLSAVSQTALKLPVFSLTNEADKITVALDMLFQGF